MQIAWSHSYIVLTARWKGKMPCSTLSFFVLFMSLWTTLNWEMCPVASPFSAAQQQQTRPTCVRLPFSNVVGNGCINLTKRQCCFFPPSFHNQHQDILLDPNASDSRFSLFSTLYCTLFVGCCFPRGKKVAEPPAKLERMCCPIYNPTSIRFYTPYFGREIERCLRPVLMLRTVRPTRSCSRVCARQLASSHLPVCSHPVLRCEKELQDGFPFGPHKLRRRRKTAPQNHKKCGQLFSHAVLRILWKLQHLYNSLLFLTSPHTHTHTHRNSFCCIFSPSRLFFFVCEWWCIKFCSFWQVWLVLRINVTNGREMHLKIYKAL